MIDVESIRKLAIGPCRTQKRYLERIISGEAFFPMADTAWEIFHRLTKEEVIIYLDKRQKQGFNSILTVLVPELDVKGYGGRLYQGEIGGDGQIIPPTDGQVVTGREDSFGGTKIFFPNRYGDTPFYDDDPAQPNENFFEFVDWVVNQAASRGLLVWIVPTWSRFVNTGWADGPIIFNAKNARSFGDFLGNRYPYCPKLIGGDSNPIWTNGLIARQRAPVIADFEKPLDPAIDLPSAYDLPRNDTYDVWNALARGISDSEAQFWRGIGKPFLTYHPCPLNFAWSPLATAANFFGDQDWLILDGCQSGHADTEKLHYDPPIRRWDARSSHEPIKLMFDSVPVRPVIDLESHYEEAFNGLQAGSSFSWDGHDIRSGAWQSVLSGACGVVYGCNVVWQMYDCDRFKEAPYCFPVCGTSAGMSWKTSLDLPGPGYIRILSDYFKSLPKNISESRHPDQSLLLSSKCPDEFKDRDGRIDIMRDGKPNEPDSTWVICHSGRGYAFSLDLTKAFPQSCQVGISWLDPRSGERIERGRIGIRSAEEFVPPSYGSVACDWVLILETSVVS